MSSQNNNDRFSPPVHHSDLSSRHDQIKVSNVTTFLTGFLFIFLGIYLALGVVFGAIYGIDVLSVILIYSMYAHFMIFPWVIYSIGGFGFLCIKDSAFYSVRSTIGRILLLGLFLVIVIVCVSEVAHAIGLLGARFRMDWR